MQKENTMKQSGWVAAFKFVPLMVFALLVIIFKMDLLLAAPIATFCALFFLYLAENFVSFIPSTLITNILYWLSINAKYTEMSSGILTLGNLVYFLSLTALFVFLNIRVIEKKRWA